MRLKAIQTEVGNAWKDSNGHFYISVKSLKRPGKWTSYPLHKAIWEKYNGPVTKGMHIHHIDHNPANNALENLACLTQLDHRRIHAGWVQTNGEWTHKPCVACKVQKALTEFRRAMRRYGWSVQGECKPCDNKRRIIRAKAKRRAVT